MESLTAADWQSERWDRLRELPDDGDDIVDYDDVANKEAT